MATLKQSTTYTRMFLMVDGTDHLTGKTGLTVTVTLSKAGGAFAAAGGTITEVSSGWYKIALTTTDTNTLGDLAFHCTATGADATDFVDQVTSLILGDSVTVGTNSDKTGYSLTQAFPTNFSSLAITGGGAVTAGTVSDKTGYSLTQSFPTNFSSLAITVGGAVTVGTNNDKTGYTASTVSDKTGYALTAAYDPAKTASQAGDAMTLTAAYDFAKGTTAMTESYPSTGSTITPAQALYTTVQMLTNFAIAGTSYTVKKVDKSTTAFTVTLNDATSPTGATR